MTAGCGAGSRSRLWSLQLEAMAAFAAVAYLFCGINFQLQLIVQGAALLSRRGIWQCHPTSSPSLLVIPFCGIKPPVRHRLGRLSTPQTRGISQRRQKGALLRGLRYEIRPNLWPARLLALGLAGGAYARQTRSALSCWPQSAMRLNLEHNRAVCAVERFGDALKPCLSRAWPRPRFRACDDARMALIGCGNAALLPLVWLMDPTINIAANFRDVNSSTPPATSARHVSTYSANGLRGRHFRVQHRRQDEPNRTIIGYIRVLSDPRSIPRHQLRLYPRKK